MRPALALIALGILAPLVQGVAGTLLPARYVPDLGFLLVVAIGWSWRSAAGGLLLSASLGYLTDLLSGSLLGQHALLRVLAFGTARLASGHLNLRGPLPQAVFVAFLTAANALGIAALTAFFASGVPFEAVPARDLLAQSLVNAVLAPLVAVSLQWLVSHLGEDESGRRLLRLEPRDFST